MANRRLSDLFIYLSFVIFNNTRPTNYKEWGQYEQVEEWFLVEEIADHLKIRKKTVYRWLEKGKIPAHCIGKQWRFKPSEVDEWVKSENASEERVEN